ncbi:MAG TPA: GGDEF domain-containing protein [Kineosporiaceae bacterium]
MDERIGAVVNEMAGEAPSGDLASALSTVQDIVEARERVASRTRADRISAAVMGLGYAAAAAACAARGHLPTAGEAVLLLALVALYAAAHRTEFVAAGGSTVPTEPVLVGLLLTAPLALVPLAVLVALQLGGTGVQESGTRWHQLQTRLISGWHCLGPVAVLAALPVGAPRLGSWPVYLLALLAQFMADAASAMLRCSALGVPPSRLVAPLRWTFAVDALLAPFGLCVVIAAHGSLAGLALLAAPIGLVRLLARDRSEQLAQAVTLGTAFTAAREQALVDPLTGLRNRRAWLEAIAEATDLLESDPSLVAVALTADVDGLKRINDSFGHEAGDELIQAMAQVLLDSAPAGSIVARLGGDEFGILMVMPGVEADLEHLPAAVRERMARQPPIHGHPLSASLGAAASPPAADVEHATRLADLAAAEDKLARRAGRD